MGTRYPPKSFSPGSEKLFGELEAFLLKYVDAPTAKGVFEDMKINLEDIADAVEPGRNNAEELERLIAEALSGLPCIIRQMNWEFNERDEYGELGESSDIEEMLDENWDSDQYEVLDSLNLIITVNFLWARGHFLPRARRDFGMARWLADRRKAERSGRPPEGATVDSLLAVALEAARHPTARQAMDAVRDALGPGAKFRRAVVTVGDMVYRNLVGRAGRSWAKRSKRQAAGAGKAGKDAKSAGPRKAGKARARAAGPDGDAAKGILYLELREPRLHLFGREWEEEVSSAGCLAASAFVLPGPVGRPSGSGPPAGGRGVPDAAAPTAPPAERVTLVGSDLELFRKLVWDLALRHGYTGPEGTVILLDGSKSAAGTGWNLFRGARRVLDFRVLETRVRGFAEDVFECDPDHDVFIGKGDDKAGEWAEELLGRLRDGGADEVLETLESFWYLDGPDEIGDLVRFIRRNMKFMDYPACFKAGLYTGDGALKRPPRGDLRGWIFDGAEVWHRRSAQAAACLIDRYWSGLWESDVAAPFRSLYGGG
ncbi:MAG: hypothetical protein LBQ79_11055 [Deltaproteobacteria bacterium]|nr:hypothetical protein [Deltaproteobacteria bacterium]